MGAPVELPSRTMSDTFHDMRSRLHGITEEEFLWIPIPGSWTVFRDDRGWREHHYEEPDPEPAPFTTIAWRLTHVAMCKVMYHEHAFGSASITWETLETPSTPEAALEMLDTGHALLTEDLAEHSDGDLERSVPTNWGERWPAWRIFWTMIHHDAHHGGELGVLRDLYRLTGGGAVRGSG